MRTVPRIDAIPHGIQITFDAADPPMLAEFWALALGYVLQPPPDGFDTWQAFAEANDMADAIDDYGSVIEGGGTDAATVTGNFGTWEATIVQPHPVPALGFPALLALAGVIAALGSVVTSPAR